MGVDPACYGAVMCALWPAVVVAGCYLYRWKGT